MKARFKRPSSLILAVVLSLSIINLRAARASEPAPDAVIYLDLEKSVPNTMGVTFFNGVVTISRNGAYKLTQSVGGATVKSVVISANDANIWLDNVNMKAVQGRSAIEAKGKNVTISLAGQNYIESDLGGIQPFAGTSLTIGSFGSLEIAAKYGNAIGSSSFESISITGGTIKASSESTSAIGLSGNPTYGKAVGKSIVINNNAVVEAHGGNGSAAIGIGTNFSGASLESITIADFAKVTAIGGYSGAGIGTGQANNETSIGTISIGSDVTAQGGQFASGIGMGYAFANVSISKIEILYALASATGGELATGIGTGYAYSFAASAIQEIVIQNSLVQAIGGKDAVGIGIAPGAQISATIKKIDINGSSVKSVGDGKSPGIGISANHMTNAAIDEISLICSMIDAVSAEGPAIGTGVQTTNKSEIKKLQSDADTTIWAESGAGAYGIGYSSPTSTYFEQIGTVLLEGKTFASSVLNDSGNDSLTNLGQLIVAYDPNNGQAIENIYDYDLADIVASGESIRVENVYLNNGDKTLLGWEATGSSSMLQTGDTITSGSALLVEKISPDLNAVKLRAVWSADSTPPSATPQVTPPFGSLPTITPIHTPTNAPQPSSTLTPTPGFDNSSKVTNTPIPTVTNAPNPTVTATPKPSATATNAPSLDKPKPTSTPQITQGPSYIKPYEKPSAPSTETRSAVFASAKDLSIQGSDGTATIEKAEVKEVAEFESMVPASEPFKVVGTAASAIVAAKIETTGVIAAAKYSEDGSAGFIDMAFEDGVAALEAKNGDILQLFALEEEKPVDDFMPTYVSREYLDYQQVNEKPKTEYDGFIPDMYNMFGGTTESSNASTKKTVNYDNAYDKKYQSAYDQRGAYYLADVKNQRDTKLCWDFSTMGALEMLMGKIYGKSFDFSESNAAYALSKKAAGFARSPLDAGNFMISAAYLTGEKGPLNEKDEPFDFLFNGKAGVNGSSVADVEEFIIMEYKISDIKDAIQKYGSVVSAIYSTAKEEDTFYYKMKNAAYYMPQSAKAPNHMIQIIGWDNEYPKTNFSQTAPLDGAWIAKNSWGEDVGDKGYFYISYADASIPLSLYAITKASLPDSSRKMYSHDPYGQTGAINFNSNSAWTSNVFQVESKGEYLDAVSFYTANSQIDYEIWASVTGEEKDKQKLTSGKSKAGYTTVKLNQPLSLGNGKFSVYVKMTAEGVVNIPIERNIENYITGAKSEAGQSFVGREGGEWIDVSAKIKGTNSCVRAWTTNAPPKTQTVKGLSKETVAFMLSNAFGLKAKNPSEAVIALGSAGAYANNPSGAITREELCFEIATLMKLNSDSGKVYTDISQSYAKKAIMALGAKGIIKPYDDGSFKPKEAVTEEVAKDWIAKAKAVAGIKA